MALGVGLNTWLRPAWGQAGGARGLLLASTGTSALQVGPTLSWTASSLLLQPNTFDIVVTAVYPDQASYNNAVGSQLGGLAYFQNTTVASPYAVTMPLIY